MIEAFADRVIVKPDDATTQKGMIIIPDTAQKRANMGTVLMVGRGKMLDSGQIVPSEARVGDRVIYGQFAGVEIEINGVTIVALRESDIVGCIKRAQRPPQED